MRIHIKTTPSIGIVPYDYQQRLIGVLHKWLGENNLHDLISLYSYSWLMNGEGKGKEGLSFNKGSEWFISFYDDTYLKKIIDTILKHPEVFGGMKVKEVFIQENPDFTNQEVFQLASPILIKRNITEDFEKHYTFNDEESNALMKETLLHKMKEAGLEQDDTLEIAFDLSYHKRKTKKVNIHGIGNIANYCPVIIKGKPETKLFAWQVGLGNCTGSGFGSLK
ncbi:CRISPR-associated endoribonuclease Cas6 [Bacteroides sp. 214]|uniref:CRISPR-associated endoribonuclease Cas6 n=1 Tax=Bacteroides sp. 214 TaxID=2302935 RepID=UPI0013D491E1|nr:CRISPR-associated endoribonuclease Cas6 [Bacteroides sp. 214]NDW13604.1 CRISPR-associated endoribonuclease Cas6 [Bacteroides sp. 214]